MTPRGIRNHNPGNIRHSPAAWLGKDTRQTDPAFVQFKAAKWGIRALYRTLRTYQTKHGLKTVAGMISRWAPPNENDTGAYVAAVARSAGVASDEPVDIRADKSAALGIVKAIIKHENGQQPYTDDEILEGING